MKRINDQGYKFSIREYYDEYQKWPIIVISEMVSLTGPGVPDNAMIKRIDGDAARTIISEYFQLLEDWNHDGRYDEADWYDIVDKLASTYF